METAVVKRTLEEEIQAHFLDFENQAGEWRKKANEIKVTDASQIDLMNEARSARLALKTIRVNVEKRHTELKADALKYGQTLDKIKRTLVGYIEPIEEYLLEQETFLEVQEEKRRKELFDKRIIELKPYISEQEAKAFPLGDMKDEAFATLLNGYKLAKEQKELKEEQDKEEKQRLVTENESLRKNQAMIQTRVNQCHLIGLSFHAIHESYCGPEGINIGMVDIKTLSDEEWDAMIAPIKKKMDAQKIKDQKQKESTEIKLQKEREERKKLEREAEAKRIEEENNKKQEQAAKRKAARAPDRDKLIALADQIDELKVDITLKDEDAAKILVNAVGLLGKTVKYIRENANKL